MYLMNAYSKDLRLKALAAIDRGVPRREVLDLFGLSRSTIKRWLKRRRQTGDASHPRDPRQALGEGRGVEAVAARAPREEPRPYIEGALRGLRGRDGRGGLRGDDEPQHS